MKIIDRCFECNHPVSKIRIVTGDDIGFWCIDHWPDVGAAMIRLLGEDVHDFVLDSNQHEIQFWGLDIQRALSSTLLNFFAELAQDLNADNTKLRILSELVKIKAQEYKSAIDVAAYLNETLIGMGQYWLSKGYIEAIGEPFGKDTFKIVKKYTYASVNVDIVQHLICLVLAAKRAESYKAHALSNPLITMERAIWDAHRSQL